MALFRKFLLAFKKVFRKRGPRRRIKSRRHRKPSRTPSKTPRRKSRPARPSRKKFSKVKKPSHRTRTKPKVKPLKKAAVTPKPVKESPGELIGEVTHYFSRIEVCVVKVNRGAIAVGDRIRISGRTAGFVQTVKSLQIENSDVQIARRGALVGLKTDKETREGDKVFRLP